jgi:hypothetical protein
MTFINGRKIIKKDFTKALGLLKQASLLGFNSASVWIGLSQL